jgi:capsular exopolysaccharide synthesis family protein
VALKSQENDALAKLQLAAGRYGIQHPERQAAEASLAAVRAALQRELGEVVKVLGNQLQAMRTNEIALEKLVAQSKNKVQEINRKDSKLSSMRQEVETNRNLYELFFNRLKETTETSGLMPLNAHILDAAILPEWPYKPKKAQGAVIAALLSMLGGIGLAFLMYQLDTSLKSADEVEEKLGLPLLGMVPYYKPQKNKENLTPVYDEESQSAFSEAIRTVRTGVVFGTLNSPNPILGISSAVEDEGKTTLVLNLGFAMAQLRRVLIIETDLRKPALANRLQFPTRQPGLCNYLLQEVSLDKCIHHLEPNLDLIIAGKIPPNPLEILSSSQFRELLEQLHEKYEMIIVDTPPLGPVSDSLVLSQLVDAVILVARAQKTPIKLIRSAISGLERVGAPVIGVILNASNAYSGKYYHHYQSPYGEYRADETAT